MRNEYAYWIGLVLNDTSKFFISAVDVSLKVNLSFLLKKNAKLEASICFQNFI